MSESLSDRLKALGFVPAANIQKNDQPLSQFDFAKILNAERLINQFGESFIVINKYPLDYQHGKVNFKTTSEISALSTAARVNTADGTGLQNLLFLDTETTGLSGGTGTLAFLIGLGYFSEDGFVLKQLILQDPSKEPAMLLELLNILDSYSGIVTYNGKGFDAPLLRSRLVLNRFPVDRFQELSHFDLLYLSRRIWKNRLPSRALQDLEHEILEIPRTEDEVPGWMIPEIYFNFQRTNDPTPLKGVVYHNGMDILSLAALFLYLSTSLENIHQVEKFDPIDYFSLGQIYFDNGMKEFAEKIFLTSYVQDKLPKDLRLKLLHNLSSMKKSRGDYDQAMIYWEEGAKYEEIESILEIAKYYEHQKKEYSSALSWTEKAIFYLEKTGYHNYQNKLLAKELLKRKDRLLTKIEKDISHV
jgi:uncharacterized protein YprB with RNaseH-like and TPR domain